MTDEEDRPKFGYYPQTGEELMDQHLNTQMLEELDDMLNQLRALRVTATNAAEAKKRVIEQAKATEAYTAADTLLVGVEERIAELDKAIRDQSLALWNADQEIPERVTVKTFTMVTITDYSAAKMWCLHNFTPCLTLDTKAFEKAAKDGGIPAELATVTKEARAQIATKL